MSDYTTRNDTGGARGLLFAVVAIIGVIVLLGLFSGGTTPTDQGATAPAADAAAPVANDEAVPAAPAPTE